MEYPLRSWELKCSTSIFQIILTNKETGRKKWILHSSELGEIDMQPQQIGTSDLSRWVRISYYATLAT